MSVVVMILHIADTFMTRLWGLHGRPSLGPDEGLLLTPCAAVHTWLLSYPIDVVFLDAEGRQNKCIHALPPFRFAWERGAHVAVELPAGYCRRHADYLQRIHAARRVRVH